MFISRFNRFFKKHGKVTYLVLLIVIIVTFVIFVTPGNVFSRGGKVTDLGEMYGKKLDVDAISMEMKKTTVAIWLQYPQVFGHDLSSLGLDKDVLLQETLMRMRFMHAARTMGLDEVSDDEVKKAIGDNQAFHENGKFSKTIFQNALKAVNQLGLQNGDFDQVVREDIIVQRLRDKVTADLTVGDEEIDKVLAQYSLKYATIPVESMAAEPSEEEILAFFNTRKSEIPLPETKTALVAVFKYDDLKAKAASDAEFAALVTPTQEAIQNYFSANGARLFPGKEFDEVSAEIAGRLLDENIRSEARKRAGELAEQFKGWFDGESAEVRQQRFQETAYDAGAPVTISVVSTEDTINGLPGVQSGLAEAIRRIAKEGEVTDRVIGANYTAVAYVAEKGETRIPAELTDYLRAVIRQKILREKALAFFRSDIQQPYEEYTAKVKAITEDTSLDNAAKQQQLMALESTVDAQLILKFFVPESRDFIQASFTPEAYRDKLQFTEEDLLKAYEAHKEVYQKVKVRLARIYLKTEGLEGEARTAKEAKLAEVLQKLRDGADFLAVAKEYSDEQPNQADEALCDLDSLPETIYPAVKNLQATQVTSEPIQDATGIYLVKVLERQEGRSFVEVQAELKEMLFAEAARNQAEADAKSFVTKVNEQWWKKDAEKLPSVAELFEEAAKDYPAVVETFTNVSPNDNSLPSQIVAKVFAATEKNPVLSSPVFMPQGVYAMALVKVTPARLTDPEQDQQAFITLLATYRDTIQMETALRKAQAERARLSEALAGNADFNTAVEPLKFADLPTISQYDVNTGATVVTSIENGTQIDISDLAAQLPDAKPGMVLEPIRAEHRFSMPGGNPYMMNVVPVGYQLVYVAGVDMEAGKTVD